MKNLSLLLCFFSALFTSGCVNNYTERQEQVKRLRVGMGVEDVTRILGKPASITLIDGVQYYRYDRVGYAGKVFHTYLPIDEITGKLRVRFVQVLSTPSPVILEINGETVGKTPYKLPILTEFKELPTPGAFDDENETPIRNTQIRAIPTVIGGLVETKYVYTSMLKREIVFRTDLRPYIPPTQIDLTIRQAR